MRMIRCNSKYEEISTYLNLIMEVLKDLRRVNENYLNLHKKLASCLAGFSNIGRVICAPSKNTIETQDRNIDLNEILDIVNNLHKTDLIHSKTIEDIQNKFHSPILQIENLKLSLNEMKKSIETYSKFFVEQIKRLSLTNELQKELLNKERSINLHYLKKMKTCVSLIFDSKIILQGRPSNIDQDLTENLKFDLNENLPVQAKIKKMKNFIELCKKFIFCIGKELITEVGTGKKITSMAVSPLSAKNEGTCLKVIVNKVNRLLNRGSLTKEEAKRVILHLNQNKKGENVESLDNKENLFCEEGDKFGKQVGDQGENDEEIPLTETRVKPGKNKSIFQSELEKGSRMPKKINKSCSVLKRRKSTNVSMSRHLSTSSFQRVNKKCN